ncbi:MAG: glycoside hydrolase family 140 protein, partial [Bacteroidia bacterium]
NLDQVVDLALERGLYLGLVPVWGSNVKAGLVTEKQAETYAKFLALRYKDKPNIVWMNGGDIRGDDSIRIWNTIGNTLKKYAPNQLVTFHPFGRTQSSEWFHNEKWLDFNMFQSGHRRYDQDSTGTGNHFGEDNWRYVQSDFAKIPAKPTLDGEPSYEGIPQGLHDTLQPLWKDNDVRRYAYWSVFSGACGFTYGNSAVMQMHKKSEKTGAYGTKQVWDEAINAPGASQMIFLKELMLKYHYVDLVPDQSVLNAPGEKYNHQVALRGNSRLLVYTYNGRTINLNSIPFPGNQLNFKWYNPRNGKYSDGGKIGKKKLLEFDPPGKIENGNDWVLIVEME